MFATVWSEMPWFCERDCCSPLMLLSRGAMSRDLLLIVPGSGIRLVTVGPDLADGEPVGCVELRRRGGKAADFSFTRTRVRSSRSIASR